MGAVATRRDVALFIDPLSYHFERDRLFDSRHSPTGGDDILGPYRYLREWLGERAVSVHTGDMLEDETAADLNLYVTMGIRRRYRRLAQRPDTILSAFFVPECPIVDPRLFVDLPAASRAFRRMYSFAEDPAMREFMPEDVSFHQFRFPYPFDGVDDEAWSRSSRGFLTIINGNKAPRLATRELYTERLRAVAFFEQRGAIDLYGVGWDGPPFRVGETRVPRPLRRIGYLAEQRWDRLRPGRDPLRAAARRAWRGSVASKSETLSRYTFAICFENMVMQGWVTEKIFDCLVAGTIPIYLGAPDIETWVDPACFVDMRRFAGYDELRDFLNALSPSEIGAFREAGREYFRSDRFRPFTKQAFAEIFGRILAEDAGVPV